jgi:hypothetical protein
MISIALHRCVLESLAFEGGFDMSLWSHTPWKYSTSEEESGSVSIVTLLQATCIYSVKIQVTRWL